jgi:hypothetical protein
MKFVSRVLFSIWDIFQRLKNSFHKSDQFNSGKVFFIKFSRYFDGIFSLEANENEFSNNFYFVGSIQFFIESIFKSNILNNILISVLPTTMIKDDDLSAFPVVSLDPIFYARFIIFIVRNSQFLIINKLNLGNWINIVLNVIEIDFLDTYS